MEYQIRRILQQSFNVYSCTWQNAPSITESSWMWISCLGIQTLQSLSENIYWSLKQPSVRSKLTGAEWVLYLFPFSFQNAVLNWPRQGPGVNSDQTVTSSLCYTSRSAVLNSPRAAKLSIFMLTKAWAWLVPQQQKCDFLWWQGDL